MFIEHNLPHQGIHLKVSCARSTLSATVDTMRARESTLARTHTCSQGTPLWWLYCSAPPR